MSTCLKDKTVKIRKEQVCHGCLEKFQPGTEMQYNVCVMGGDFYAGYQCKICEEIEASCYSDDYSEGFPEGWVKEDYFEEYTRLKGE